MSEEPTLSIDFTTNGNFLSFRSHGWSAPEPHGVWSDGTEAFILLTGLRPGVSYRAEFVADPYCPAPAVTGQAIWVRNDGQQLFSDFRNTPARLSFAVAAPLVSAGGELPLTFWFPDAVSPRDLQLSNDGRKLGFSFWRAEFFELGAAAGEVAVVTAVPPAPVIPPPPVTAPAPVTLTGKAGKVAAVTMVYNESEYLPIWLRHYAAQVGIENCFVVDHGSDDGSTAGLAGCNVVRIPRSPYDPILQSSFAAKFCASLLCWYDRVLFADTDEIVVADPKIAANLVEFCQRPLPEVLHVIGLNVQHLPGLEPEIDLSRKITEQRSWVVASSSMCKATLIGREVRWPGGSHSADAPVAFDHLYNFHLRWFDRASGMRRIAKTRAMAWAHHQGGGHQRISDDAFLQQLDGFANIPRIEGVDFDPAAAPVGDFLQAVIDSQAGREFHPYRIDLDIWWSRLWKVPERFVGIF